MTQQAEIQTDRPSGGVPANGWNITLAWFLIFFFCDNNFCTRPETKPENRFLRGLIHGIHRMAIHCYRFSRGIKLLKISDFPSFYPKTPLKILKLAYYRHYCTDSDQILHSDRDHQNTLCGWSKQAYNKSKMADGPHLEKSKRPYLRNGLSDLHKIWHDDAFQPSLGYGQLKFPTF